MSALRELVDFGWKVCRQPRIDVTGALHVFLCRLADATLINLLTQNPGLIEVDPGVVIDVCVILVKAC